MNHKELADLVPVLAEKLEGTTPARPVVGGETHEQTPNWVFRTGPVLTLASLFTERNELRLTYGLAIDIPYTAQLVQYVNHLNHKQMTFGRAFLVHYIDSEIAALVTQEIVYGDGLSLDFLPSIQNLLRIMGTLCGQGEVMSSEIISRFGGQPFNDAQMVILLASC
jgi:hypothetical protein